MKIISGKFPCYLRMCISLHSRNVLGAFRLMEWHKIMYKDINPSVGTQCIHISLNFTVITIDATVVFCANKMRNCMLSVFRIL